MSIVINLMAVPRRISPDKWTEAYEESLRLLQAYDFMDRFSAQRNGLAYDYAERSRDVDNFLDSGHRGWRSVGDMRTGDNTEEFIVFGDIHAYLPPEQGADGGGDILLSILDDGKGIGAAAGPERCVNLWGGRTEGEDSHIYLLAVGCLFTSRFPEAVTVTGSISAGQCARAVRWANQYLDKAIHVPDIGSMDRLLERLKSTAIPRGKLMEAFFRLTLEPGKHKMGEYLRGEFTQEEISSYYKQRFAKFHSGQRGFVTVLKEYLEMGFPFKELCRLAVCESDGPKAPPEEFIMHVMNSRLYIKEKETGDFTRLSALQEDSGKVDSKRQEIGRILGMLCGAENRNVNAYYPLDKIRQDCREAIGGLCDTDGIIDKFLASERESEKIRGGKVSLQALLYDLPHSIFRQEEERCGGGREPKYDVGAYKELGSFFPGCSMRPELEADLLKNFRAIHRYAEKEFEEFRLLDRKERENYLISNNQRVLIRKNIWDRIFERIMEDAYIIRIFGIFGVNTMREEGFLFCRNVLASPDAIDYFWERTADEIQRNETDTGK